MKIEYLYIDGYKNLAGLEVHFESGISLIAILGKNGSGKSNVLEAIAKIFIFVMNSAEEPEFKFCIRYIIHGDKINIDNRSGSVRITKNNEKVLKSLRSSVVPLTVFVYYAGETKRLTGLADEVIDKTFDRCIKNGDTTSYKSISKLSIQDFGLSLMVERCYGSGRSRMLEDILGIEAVSKRCKLYFTRPPWGKNGKPENFWNAQGYIKEVIELLHQAGSCDIINRDEFIILLPNCEDIRDDMMGPEGLFKALKILSQANILSHVEIDVITDGATFDCNELSEGEKQLGNLLLIMSFTREYSALFLLDEFDSYLHPTWQRIFADLIMKEEITGQVIFTTHSSLTLSQMKRKNVFFIRHGGIYESTIDAYNRDISEIMEELMGVSMRPEHIEGMISEFNKAIAQRRLAVAKQLRSDLIEHLSEDDPFFITADISIARIERA